MNLTSSIENMISRLTPGESTTISRKIELYSNGVIAKFKNAKYALEKLEELNRYTDDKFFSEDDELNVSERIHFYLDSFFAFLYSTFDVISQVINQRNRLNFDEKRVSFKRINENLAANQYGTDLQQEIDSTIRARYFKNLDKYRNCSTHRRQIYVRCEANLVTETPGYSATDDITTIKRIICDNPYAINPTTNQDRELIDYTEKMLHWTENKIIEIANKIN